MKHPLQPNIDVNAGFVLSRRACAQSVAIPDVVKGFGSRLIASANDRRTRATRHDVVGTAVGAQGSDWSPQRRQNCVPAGVRALLLGGDKVILYDLHCLLVGSCGTRPKSAAAKAYR